ERRDDAALNPCIPGAALPGLRAVPSEGLSVAATKKPATKTATKPAPRAAKAKTKVKAVAGAGSTAAVTVPPPVDVELGGHWHEFKTSGAIASREKLILHYAPLVKYVASRVATGLPATVEQADLVSYGMFGLMDPLWKFEQSGR